MISNQSLQNTGISSAFKQKLDVFLAVYQEDKLTSEQRIHEMAAQLQGLSLSMSAIRSETMGGQNGKSSNRDSQMIQVQGIQEPEEGEIRQYVPRYSNLDCPRYDGQIDLLRWINRYEHFFRHQYTSANEKVESTSFHLEGYSIVVLKIRTRLTGLTICAI